jgi:hypothetical protein
VKLLSQVPSTLVLKNISAPNVVGSRVALIKW